MTALEDLSGLGSSSMLFVMLLFVEHPQFKKLFAQQGVYEVKKLFLFHIQTHSITIPMWIRNIG